jgi:mannose-1-phosphate guanylyltransferase
MTPREPQNSQLSAIILAGGDGSRLRSLTRKIAGEEVPKQFCPVLGDETSLTRPASASRLSYRPRER